jgi:hypothetical protein
MEEGWCGSEPLLIREQSDMATRSISYPEWKGYGVVLGRMELDTRSISYPE